MVRESCCPPGAFGAMDLSSDDDSSKPERPLQGKTVSLSGRNHQQSSQRTALPCYQVGPDQPQQLVLVFSDVHGVDTGNHKVFCSALQAKLDNSTTAVWMPDLFRGYPMAPDVGTKTFWVDLWCRLSIIWAEKTRITVPAVRADLEEILQCNIPASVQSVGMVA